ncbi:uncharacterized protein LOC143037427 isoform X1 [Oratosquilla oratoria]|uniref:uncharacterized protein LOC143037427 isoform X1 n=1 Tax=Oratosquilla oratoria TaxID=337810 RepID=UPI003F76C6E1
MPVPSQEVILPIIPTDLRFFHDSFFEESRRHFEMAVKEITEKCGLSSKDPVSSYRSLRQKELKTDNQAVSVTDEVNTRKFVLDVKDFRDGELSVKVVDDSVVTEGRIERKQGGSSSTHSFRQRFSLPKSVDLEAVTSTISSDGILTITAPKTKQRQSVTEKQKKFNQKNSSSEVNVIKSSTTNTESHTESHKINKYNTDNQSTSRKSTPKLDITKEVPNHDMISDTKKLALETPLPLVLRGSFFDDSFFNHAHKDFEAAMESVLRSHDIETSSMEARKKYRSLRKDKLVDETQAVTMSEDDTYHKIVLDVQDFKDGDVTVKGVGRSLVVEGSVKKTSSGSVSSHSFRRRFSLPSQAHISDVTAALSSDGILTILVKKNINALKESAVEVSIPIAGKADYQENEANSCSQKNEEKKMSYLETLQKDQEKKKEAPSKEEPIGMKARDTKSEVGHLLKELHGQEHSRVTKEQEQKIEICEQLKTTKSQTLSSQQQETKMHSKSDKEKATISLAFQSEVTTPLPIENRGDFFQDPFFSNDRKNFQSAVSTILERHGMKSSIDDDLKSYKALRKSISVDESQAVRISNEETEYKVVMDMSDFVEGEVKVKVDGQKLVVESSTEKKESNSSSSRSFRRCITFPTLVNMEAVTSALSSDGVLTITAPKKKVVSTVQTEECNKEEDKSRVTTIPNKVHEGLSTIMRNTTKTTSGWSEQSSYHESSFVGKINHESSSKTLQSTSTSSNIA